MSDLNHALILSLMGNHKSALESLNNIKSDDVQKLEFKVGMAKASFQMKLGESEEAIKTIDGTKCANQVESYYSYILLAQAFLQNNEPKSAHVALSESAKVWEEASALMKDNERAESQSQKEFIQKQVDMERQNTDVIGDINEYAFLGQDPKQSALAQVEKPKVKPSFDLKYDWYQNQTHVFVSFKILGGDKEFSKKIRVVFEKESILIEGPPSDDQQQLVIPLAMPVVVDESTSTPYAVKIELKLKKEKQGQNWLGLEPSKNQTLLAQVPNASAAGKATEKAKPYASSKNWDKIDQDLKKDLDSEKPEGDGALNSLFKQIYERADENTRRAMMKSYQTSGGTVLSTNWDEVASKDYEGTDRPSAPDGQMWADEAEKIKKEQK